MKQMLGHLYYSGSGCGRSVKSKIKIYFSLDGPIHVNCIGGLNQGLEISTNKIQN